MLAQRFKLHPALKASIRPEQTQGMLRKAPSVASNAAGLAVCKWLGIRPDLLRASLHALCAGNMAALEGTLRDTQWEVTSATGTYVQPVTLTSASAVKLQVSASDQGRWITDIELTVQGGASSTATDVVIATLDGMGANTLQDFASEQTGGGKLVLKFSRPWTVGKHYLSLQAPGWASGSDVRVYIKARSIPLTDEFLDSLSALSGISEADDDDDDDGDAGDLLTNLGAAKGASLAVGHVADAANATQGSGSRFSGAFKGALASRFGSSGTGLLSSMHASLGTSGLSSRLSRRHAGVSSGSALAGRIAGMFGGGD